MDAQQQAQAKDETLDLSKFGIYGGTEVQSTPAPAVHRPGYIQSTAIDDTDDILDTDFHPAPDEDIPTEKVQVAPRRKFHFSLKETAGKVLHYFGDRPRATTALFGMAMMGAAIGLTAAIGSYGLGQRLLIYIGVRALLYSAFDFGKAWHSDDED